MIGAVNSAPNGIEIRYYKQMLNEAQRKELGKLSELLVRYFKEGAANVQTFRSEGSHMGVGWAGDNEERVEI